MQYHSKILKIVKVTKKNVNRLVFFGHPLQCTNVSKRHLYCTLGSEFTETVSRLHPNLKENEF